MANISDGQSSFRNGNNVNDTDGQVANSYFAGVNVRIFGDDLVPRFPYKHLPFVYPEGLFNKRFSLETILRTGNPQALIPFDTSEGSYLILIINGVWFRVNPNTMHAQLIPYENNDERIGANCQNVNWAIVDNAIVVYDGDLPLIFNGNPIRRASYDATYTFIDATGQEVTIPVPEGIRSYIGFYDSLRMWLGIGANVLAASDARGETPNAPLSFFQSFTEDGEFTGEFPVLGSSTKFNDITAIGTLVAQSPTFTGQLFASTREGIYLIQSQTPRASWTSTAGFITKVLNNTGIISQKGWVNKGYDLLYIDPEGRLNSLSLNQQNLARWSETEISTEVDNFIRASDNSLYKYSQIEEFENLVLMTSKPYITERFNNRGTRIGSVAFKGLLCLSTENLSGLNQQASPAWNGLWTGVNPMLTGVLKDKMYILGDVDGENQLFQVNNEIGNDSYQNEEKLIRSRVHFNNFRFDNTLGNDKTLRYLDISASAINSEFTVFAEYKPDVQTFWNFLGCRTFKKLDCLIESQDAILSNDNGYLKSYRMSPPPDACGGGQRFRSLDLRLTFEGLWQLKHFQLRAEVFPDSTTHEFNEQNGSVTRCCSDVTDYNLYSINFGKSEIEYQEYYKTNCKTGC